MRGLTKQIRQKERNLIFFSSFYNCHQEYLLDNTYRFGGYELLPILEKVKDKIFN